MKINLLWPALAGVIIGGFLSVGCESPSPSASASASDKTKYIQGEYVIVRCGHVDRVVLFFEKDEKKFAVYVDTIIQIKE